VRKCQRPLFVISQRVGGAIETKRLHANRNERVARANFGLGARRNLQKLAALSIMPVSGHNSADHGLVADCPVCFEPFDADVHERSIWQCGHAVCVACDGRMASNGLHQCPTCRTPRSGMSAESARNAAEQARLRDLREEETAFGFFLRQLGNRLEGGGIDSAGTTLPDPNQRRNEVLFFANEANGNGPADILQDVEDVVRSGGFRTLLQTSDDARTSPHRVLVYNAGYLSETTDELEGEPRDALNGIAAMIQSLARPGNLDSLPLWMRRVQQRAQHAQAQAQAAALEALGRR
jgi:hypothetical protein